MSPKSNYRSSNSSSSSSSSSNNNNQKSFAPYASKFSVDMLHATPISESIILVQSTSACCVPSRPILISSYRVMLPSPILDFRAIFAKPPAKCSKKESHPIIDAYASCVYNRLHREEGCCFTTNCSTKRRHFSARIVHEPFRACTV